MKKPILKFPQEGLQQLQFFVEGISFPVAVAAYSEQEINKISYLARLLKRKDICSTYALCVWCIRQKVPYQIMFRISVRRALRHPVQFYDFLRLQRVLMNYKKQIQGK